MSNIFGTIESHEYDVVTIDEELDLRQGANIAFDNGVKVSEHSGNLHVSAAALVCNGNVRGTYVLGDGSLLTGIGGANGQPSRWGTTATITDIYNLPSGNVGIGTGNVAITERLLVNGSVKTLSGNIETSGYLLGNGSLISNLPNPSKWTTNGDTIYNTANGNVGIGNVVATHKLSIEGNQYLNGTLTSGDINCVHFTAATLSGDGGGLSNVAGGTGSRWAQHSPSGAIYYNGKVAINSTYDTPYPLYINGNVSVNGDAYPDWKMTNAFLDFDGDEVGIQMTGSSINTIRMGTQAQASNVAVITTNKIQCGDAAHFQKYNNAYNTTYKERYAVMTYYWNTETLDVVYDSIDNGVWSFTKGDPYCLLRNTGGTLDVGAAFAAVVSIHDDSDGRYAKLNMPRVLGGGTTDAMFVGDTQNIRLWLRVGGNNPEFTIIIHLRDV